jgi:integrase
MLVDPFGVPRYWVTVWVSFLPGHLASSTLNRKLRQTAAGRAPVCDRYGSAAQPLFIAVEHQGSLSDRLLSVQLLNAHLHIGKRRRPERIRSLPAEVVEALYEMLDPESSSNPFVGAASRWRVYTIFMLLLHQGLRRGELLTFSVDCIKSALTVSNNEFVTGWMFGTTSTKTKTHDTRLQV